jgi:hypothetical protein
MGPVFAVQPTTNEVDDPDTDVYRKAREQEEKMAAQYVSDSMQWFSKKLDTAIKKDVELKKFFWKGYCDGCASVVLPDLDQALIEYFDRVPPLTKSLAYDYLSLVKPHLDPRISEVSNTDTRALNTLMNFMTDSIMSQVKEQMTLSRDIAPMGLAYDGDTDNSQYDLMVDIQWVEKRIFEEIPEWWPYKNTSKEDTAGLIHGKNSLMGEWVWSENLNTVIASALGVDSLWPVKLVAADTCWPNGCTSVFDKPNTYTSKFYKNSSNGHAPKGNQDTLEGIYGEMLEFMTKYWINRNNACKIPPSWYLYQWQMDVNTNKLLEELFSMWVYAVQEVPELLKWFMNRESRTRESEDRQIDDSLERAFKSRWMSKRPEEVLVAGAERRIEAASRETTDKDLPALASVNALGYANAAYGKYIESLWKWMEGTFIKKHSIESMEHLSVVFEEMEARANSMNSFSETLKIIGRYLLSKWECQPS